MIIGIITFFNAHNYGAVWQAYALKQYIKKQGHECYIINYRNKFIEKAYPKNLKPRIRKKHYLNPFYIKSNIKELDVWLHSRSGWHIQYEKFVKFINAVLLDGNDKIEYEAQISKCDVLIFGSDQVWERNIIGAQDKVYIGDFNFNGKKVSYAASCFSENSQIDDAMINSIMKFDFISVREKAFAERLRKLLPDYNNINVVVDPVFLLSKEDYGMLINRSSFCLDKPYILFYMVCENDEMNKMSRFLREILNKNIIEIHYYRDSKINQEWQKSDVGPMEFLNYIRNAEFVITNSFHGVAFSLIFEKYFIAVNDNMRILNLLDCLGLVDRIVLTCTNIEKTVNSVIDYNIINCKIRELTRDSRLFLQEIFNLSMENGNDK